MGLLRSCALCARLTAQRGDCQRSFASGSTLPSPSSSSPSRGPAAAARPSQRRVDWSAPTPTPAAQPRPAVSSRPPLDRPPPSAARLPSDNRALPPHMLGNGRSMAPQTGRQRSPPYSKPSTSSDNRLWGGSGNRGGQDFRPELTRRAGKQSPALESVRRGENRNPGRFTGVPSDTAGRTAQHRWGPATDGRSPRSSLGLGRSPTSPQTKLPAEAPAASDPFAASPFDADEADGDTDSANDLSPGRSSRADARKRDAEKRLRRATAEKPPLVVFSKAALEKKAKKAAELASGEAQARERRAQEKAQRQLAIPSVIRVAQMAQLAGLKLRALQSRMETMGHADVRPDRVLTTDDAALIALECGYEPVVDDALAFDIYPDPPAGDSADTPARPPIVCVMGHVDHGKTTLLDALRSTSVAAGEAGGITQHIGAFQIGLDEVFEATGKASGALSSDSQQTITFLDTPGHAAFSEMRSRGANVTDVAVVVVAADDGVKPQTKEVIDLVKKTDVGVVVAITKCDKPGVDLHQTRAGIYGAGLEIEILGGDVPCVEVSAVTKKGLSELVETIAAVAEVRDLRAEQKGVRFQGRVIESDLGRERGAVTTILVLRGTLEVGSNLIAGHCYGRARQLFSASGEALQQALPGQPVQVTGWRTLPPAGAEVLLADSEDDAKRATENRIRRQAQFEALAEVEAINEKRSTRQDERESVKLETEGMNRQEKRQLAWHKDQAIRAQNRDEDSKVKELTVVVRADVAGTLEAVVAAIGGLGNDAVKVKVIGEGVGSVTESDVALAAAAKGIVVGFNVDIDRAAFPLLGLHQVPCHTETVIYRLIDLVTEKLAALLPKRYEDKVAGEATVLQVFETNLKKNQKQMIAGCRVGNGEVRKGCRIRLTRDMRTIWEGDLAQLRQGKKDASSISKGNECGMAFAEFQDFAIGDKILALEKVEIPRRLDDGL